MHLRRPILRYYPEVFIKDPPGGFHFIGERTGSFILELENWQAARLQIYTSELTPLAEFEILPNPSHPKLITVTLESLPSEFAYSWQIQREGTWGHPFADPLHPWLAGKHQWRSKARFDLSWVDSNKYQTLTSNITNSNLINRPHHSWNKLKIYECHVRAATMQHPEIPKDLRGTLEALPCILDHVQSIGCNAIELLPLHEFNELNTPFLHPTTGEQLVNFWGYMPLHLMAIMRGYSHVGTSIEAEEALIQFVKQAHERNIEVVLDVVFNHVDRQPFQSLWQTFPNSGFHCHQSTGELVDYTGCGNTLQVQHFATGSIILQSLRYWAMRFGVDGFRFDLAGSFARQLDSSCNPQALFLQRLTQDPILGHLKLIVEPWDAHGAWLVGKMAPLGFYEWNDRFRDDVRRFIHFGENKGLMATRLCGSQDIYTTQNKPHGIHYITCHDGFCLRDLVSYNTKHNEGNGENGRDGHMNNLSRNHGVEGPTEDNLISALRERQIRNFMLALAVSHGPIMVTSGDEYGHTRHGNNNPWCQDNELNALDWDLIKKQPALMNYWQSLMNWRSQFSLLEEERFYTPEECLWHQADGSQADWTSEPGLLILQLIQSHARALIIFNSTDSIKLIRLPLCPKPWRLIASSQEVHPNQIASETPIALIPWSSALLQADNC